MDFPYKIPFIVNLRNIMYKGNCDYLEHDFKKVDVLNLDLSIILSFFLTLLVHVHLHSD